MNKQMLFWSMLMMALLTGCGYSSEQTLPIDSGGGTVSVVKQISLVDSDKDDYYVCYADGVQQPPESCETNKYDCNDQDASVHQEAPELCDRKDNQCPGDRGYGQIDENIVCECVTTSDCADELFCNGVEICADHVCKTESLACRAGKVCDEKGDRCVECLNDNDCSSKHCDSVSNVCVECLNHSDCDNSVFCDGEETCDTVTNSCQAAHTPACGKKICDEMRRSCSGCQEDAECEESMFCNLMLLSCEAVPCPDDGLDCTTEVVENHLCVHQPNSSC